MPSAKLIQIMDGLAAEYPDRRPLINYSNPFELVAAVALSAQTTDAAVNRVTPEIFRLWPAAGDLANANPEQLEQILHPLGFFRQKTKNLIACAKMLVEDFHNSIPQSMEELTRLPGIGRKCANVIRCQLWDMPGIIVDTHFGRVCRRLGLTDHKDPNIVEQQLSRMIPLERQKEFSMTANYHGRRCCYARKPDCSKCPVESLCAKKI